MSGFESFMGKEGIRLVAQEVGRDILLLITGGEAHIGAVSTAYRTEAGTQVHTTAIPGHKEQLLSADFALQASMRLNRTVTIVMGIHYDHLSPSQIESVCMLAERELENFLQIESPSSYDKSREANG
ncbi:prenylated flavin chaperone LpdD [Paenibacillus tuaregi]|uniref:prenylated flavin chaperone LpdD n=1 Tax=Paenibacillus tuaregi TaxID=1816681 RepID=UPI000B2AC195|nr:hypothetical protein [Paenibacillus tuaregi]